MEADRSESSFGKTIRDARKRADLSQKELAERANIDFTYLSKIENDRMPAPSEKTIRALAALLGLDVDELIRLAGYLPADLEAFFVQEPLAIKYLRSLQGDMKTKQDWIDLLNQRSKDQA